MQQYDIVIVGGGMVGATLACALAKLPYSVAVLEAFEFSPNSSSPSFDDRSVALSYGSRLLMQDMGLWSSIQEHAQGIAEIQISERKRLGLTRMQASEEGVDALGYVLENRSLGAVFQQQIANADRLEWIAPAKVTAVTTRAGGVQLSYEQQGRQQELQATLLIAADGANSFVRGCLDIDAQTTDYGLSAIIANVQTQLPHEGVAYERFTSTGPLALLPLQPFERRSRSSVVMTVKHEEVEGLMAMDDLAFLKELQTRFGQRLGRLQKVGQRAAYPVALVQAEKCSANHSLIIGNAAQSLNPVAGQGFNLALRDVAALLDVLQGPHVLGSPEFIAAYKASREQDRDNTIRFTDSLVKVFSNTLTPLAHLRAGSLMMADLVEPLRQRFVRQGMGLNAQRRIKGGLK